jgi:hypothetical protein
MTRKDWLNISGIPKKAESLRYISVGQRPTERNAGYNLSPERAKYSVNQIITPFQGLNCCNAFLTQRIALGYNIYGFQPLLLKIKILHKTVIGNVT